MDLEIGKIYTGKVKSITQYGAFVEIENSVTGMVHISEIANTYVNEIRDFIKEGQEVKVKVININEQGKISLSIKKADENADRKPPHRERRSKSNVYEPKKTVPQSEMTFDDMLAHFKQSSEERISDLKRSTDRKNGSRRK